jgi:hypothetical protein
MFRWCLRCFGGGDVGASSNSIVGELLVHADVDSRVERDGRDQERLEARQAVLFDRFAKLADSVLDRRRQAVVEVGFSLVASLERRSWKVRALGEIVAVGKWIYGATESWSCALSRKRRTASKASFWHGAVADGTEERGDLLVFISVVGY